MSTFHWNTYAKTEIVWIVLIDAQFLVKLWFWSTQPFEALNRGKHYFYIDVPSHVGSSVDVCMCTCRNDKITYIISHAYEELSLLPLERLLPV